MPLSTIGLIHVIAAVEGSILAGKFSPFHIMALFITAICARIR
ncbi:hypothetical protein CLV58_11370 [Spirosoma oryzae]|uniref:Uncharacterized protein n=1 Tax=Spirosoma oryzae TaxID=1469603 RepID=A0A2T0SRA0_9BACT|nr:hypothetical protein [Spirosoma oryzae]PRY35942.1 hypothetical protein CLV58_11370 [Spirosoma oryzae]